MELMESYLMVTMVCSNCSSKAGHLRITSQKETTVEVTPREICTYTRCIKCDQVGEVQLLPILLPE